MIHKKSADYLPAVKAYWNFYYINIFNQYKVWKNLLNDLSVMCR